jgi:hypothetical protein
LARLVDRLLTVAERAAAHGAWDRAEEIAQHILAVAPEDRRAADLLQRARVQESPPAGERALVNLLFADIVRSTDSHTKTRLALPVQPASMRARILQTRNDVAPERPCPPVTRMGDVMAPPQTHSLWFLVTSNVFYGSLPMTPHNARM